MRHAESYEATWNPSFFSSTLSSFWTEPSVQRRSFRPFGVEADAEVVAITASTFFGGGTNVGHYVSAKSVERICTIRSGSIPGFLHPLTIRNTHLRDISNNFVPDFKFLQSSTPAPCHSREHLP